MIGVFTTTTNTAATCNCSLQAMGGGRGAAGDEKSFYSCTGGS